MKIEYSGKIAPGQDGAIFKDLLFRFNTKGVCSVYSLERISDDPAPVSQFVLDKADRLVPHSNSVAFGSTYYAEDDEFPLLYSNVYNNYAKCDKKEKGVTCVYRITREGDSFSATLVQVIEIGFTEDLLWRSENTEDVRPYGNFAIDGENSLYYAFTMRDGDKATRYFSFRLPDVDSGSYDAELGVKRAVLKKTDIISFFDCEYHRFIQGACFHNGIIYSLEGFTNDEKNRPAIRLIDTVKNAQKDVYYFPDFGLTLEPELVDFKDDVCYYADGYGNLYKLEF